jgi:DNA-binding NarL/FixJ family response regulator
MAFPEPPRVVAVLDSDPDTIEMLKTWLEFHGFVAAVGNLIEFRLGHDSLVAFLDRTSPDVIVYDLGLPYETNYHFLQTVSAEPAFRRAALVLTTTNASVVQSLLGVQAIEIVGKPYDLGVLLDAIRAGGIGTAVKSPESAADRRRGDRRKGDRRTSSQPATVETNSPLH